MATWGPLESLATAGGTVLTALGLFAMAQRDKGKLEQKVKDMDKKLTDDIALRLAAHDISITAHTATLIQHEGSFKVIDTKLDNIKETEIRVEASIEKMADKLDKHCEGISGK